MPTETLTFTGHLVVEVCWCGIRHAIPSQLARQASHNGKAVFCPLGHKWVVKKTEAEKLEEQLRWARDDKARLAATLEQTKASLHGQKIRASRFKNDRDREREKAHAGVCPVVGCKRHFQNLERHMASKHPDFTEPEPEA